VPVLSKKCTIRIGSPIPYLYLKRIKIGGCVLIILISTRHAKKIVDSTIGCSLLSFLDCYSGYHQIPLKEEDQIKTSFISLFNVFCYTMMSFGLKSAGATYQWGIQQCLHTQLRRNVEAYVDDVVIKTREDKGLIFDLAETFDNLRKFKMKASMRD
jgi:hypothetical protein